MDEFEFEMSEHDNQNLNQERLEHLIAEILIAYYKAKKDMRSIDAPPSSDNKRLEE
jgi:hypothetical protein